MGIIAGKNVVLYIAVGGSPYDLLPIACGRDCSVEMAVELLETTTEGTGTTRTYKPVASSWKMTASGIASTDNIPVREILSLAQGLQEVYVSFNPDDGGADYTGVGVIISCKNSGNYNDVSMFDVSMQGSGELAV